MSPSESVRVITDITYPPATSLCQRVLLLLFEGCDTLKQASISPTMACKKKLSRTCFLSSFRLAISAALSSFDIAADDAGEVPLLCTGSVLLVSDSIGERNAAGACIRACVVASLLWVGAGGDAQSSSSDRKYLCLALFTEYYQSTLTVLHRRWPTESNTLYT